MSNTKEEIVKSCIHKLEEIRNVIIKTYPKSDNNDYPNTSLEDDTAYELIGSFGTVFDSLGTLIVESIRKEATHA